MPQVFVALHLALEHGRADAEQHAAAQRHPLLAKVALVDGSAPASVEPGQSTATSVIERRESCRCRRRRLRVQGRGSASDAGAAAGRRAVNGGHGGSLLPRERQVEKEVLRFELQDAARASIAIAR